MVKIHLTWGFVNVDFLKKLFKREKGKALFRITLIQVTGAIIYFLKKNDFHIKN